jgi:hypothetical protein
VNVTEIRRREVCRRSASVKSRRGAEICRREMRRRSASGRSLRGLEFPSAGGASAVCVREIPARGGTGISGACQEIRFRASVGSARQGIPCRVSARVWKPLTTHRTSAVRVEGLIPACGARREVDPGVCLRPSDASSKSSIGVPLTRRASVRVVGSTPWCVRIRRQGLPMRRVADKQLIKPGLENPNRHKDGELQGAIQPRLPRPVRRGRQGRPVTGIARGSDAAERR